MFDFPASPANGTQVSNSGATYRYDGVKWVATVAAAPPPGAIISATAPTGQIPGALWWDTIGGNLYCLFNDGSSTQWVPASNIGLANVATIADAAKNTGRNLIHNALFNVQQRGVGVFVPAVPGGIYTADRWFVSSISAGDASNVTVPIASDGNRSQVGDEAMQYMLANTFTGGGGAGNACLITQNIERIQRLSGKTVTVSFWAVASAALKLGVSFDQNFGTGGSPSAQVSVAGQSISLSGTFARYSLTFAIPSSIGKTFGTNLNDFTAFNFWYSAGSSFNTRSGSVGVQSGTIWVWGVQVEIGSTATPLEKPDPQVDLANCQRFAQSVSFVNYGYNGAGLSTAGSTMLPVKMRTTPTLTLLGSLTASNLTGVSAGANAEAVWWSGNVSVAGGYIFNAAYLASADL